MEDVIQGLNLDELNRIYFYSLYKQKQNPNREELIIGKNTFPTAIASKELLSQLPHVQYSKLVKEGANLSAEAKKLSLWIKKTHGGGGTSIKREKYLERIKGTKKIHLGAKGTDLFIPIEGKFVSLAEIQILQAYRDLENKKFGEIFLHNIVSSESKSSLDELWKKKSLVDPALSYNELVKNRKDFYYFGETFQSVLPTIDDKGMISNLRLAPGGHGFFAVDALLAALEPKKRPQSKFPLISVIGNGEDLGSTPDEIVLGWAYKNKVAITMLTTEKTENDSKGGQISLVEGENEVYVTLIEQAQAKHVGQLELFEKIGLEIKNKDQQAFFNTNVAIFNYEILVPCLEKLIHKIGKERFLEVITPTLIENKKKQRDSDGVTRVYEQLEGAMGSTLLNLDREWRRNFGEPLVHFVNVEREYRTQFFSPIKTAFDFFMLFYSDRYSFDSTTFRLKDLRPGHLPAVVLEDEFYQEVENVLEAFEGSKILKCDKIEIRGSGVLLKNVEFKGKVTIENHSGKIADLTHLKKLSDQVVSI